MNGTLGVAALAARPGPTDPVCSVAIQAAVIRQAGPCADRLTGEELL